MTHFVVITIRSASSAASKTWAIAKLEKPLLAHPNDRDILAVLASFHEARGDVGAAKQYAARLRALSER